MENEFNNKKYEYSDFVMFDTVDCPQCGNECTVNKKFKYHRCIYCRCHFEIITRNNKKKNIIDVKEDPIWKKHWKKPVKKNNYNESSK